MIFCHSPNLFFFLKETSLRTFHKYKNWRTLLYDFLANLSVWLARSNQWPSVFIDSCSGGEDHHFNQLSCFPNPQVLFLRTPLKEDNCWSIPFSHPYCDYYADGHNNVTSVFTLYPLSLGFAVETIYFVLVHLNCLKIFSEFLCFCRFFNN